MLGKSYLTALFCVVRAVLYPGSKIILASGNKKQAGQIITEKIRDMKNNSIALNREIDDIKENSLRIYCSFKNGSIIEASVSGDGARGLRGNILVVDEYRLVKEDDINQVLKQFLTNPRKPGFMSKPEYMNTVEPEANKELYLSSRWYKSHWSYDRFMSIVNNFFEGKKSFACDIPYICTLDHRLVLKDKIDQDRIDIGEMRFEMEYCGKPFATVYRNIYFKLVKFGES